MTAMTEDRMNYMAFNDPNVELLNSLMEQLVEQERRHIKATVVLELAAKTDRLDMFDQNQLGAVMRERAALELQHEPLCEWIAAVTRWHVPSWTRTASSCLARDPQYQTPTSTVPLPTR
jgi:hypothetical protein